MFNLLKQIFKKLPGAKMFSLYRATLANRPSFWQKNFLFKDFFVDFKKYKKINKNPNFTINKKDLKPCLADKTSQTPLDYVYFYQDSWCAKKIFEAKPKHHYDIGSKAEFVGIISQFVPTTMIDIRPLDILMPGLDFVEGDITHLKFADNSLDSVSSICVIEHVGLGRYGDDLDGFGSEKSAEELKRVLAPGGSLYISLPIDAVNTIYFNAHRAFTRDYVLKMFQLLTLVEEKYIYKKRLAENYDTARGFGTGLFHFKKQ